MFPAVEKNACPWRGAFQMAWYLESRFTLTKLTAIKKRSTNNLLFTYSLLWLRKILYSVLCKKYRAEYDRLGDNKKYSSTTPLALHAKSEGAAGQQHPACTSILQ